MKDTYTYSLCKICHNGKFSHTCKVVELTELDMGALEIACDCIEGYNEECANKIRKVLE